MPVVCVCRTPAHRVRVFASDFASFEGKCFRWFQWKGTQFDVDRRGRVGSIAAVHTLAMERATRNDCFWLYDLSRNRRVRLYWCWIHWRVRSRSK